MQPVTRSIQSLLNMQAIVIHYAAGNWSNKTLNTTKHPLYNIRQHRPPVYGRYRASLHKCSAGSINQADKGAAA